MQAINLKDIEITIATVVSADDEKKLGRIKVAAPGMFDLSVMDEEALPWIYPFCMSGFQTYSRQQNGNKVWLLHHKLVAEAYWYLPYHELHETTKEIIDDDIESDVLISRVVGDKVIQIYHNKTNGLAIKYDKAELTFNQEGQIMLKSDDVAVKIENGKVYLGTTEDDFEQAVRGNSLKQLLQDLATDLNGLATNAVASPYTANLADGFTKGASNLTSNIENILSDIALVGK